MFSWFRRFFALDRRDRSPDKRKRTPPLRLEVEGLEERCLLDANPAVTPAPLPFAEWQDRANQLLQQKGDPQVVFMGDSITQLYQTGAGAPVWNSQIAPLGAVNYGISGSMTSNVLWQIATGQLSDIHPKVIVLMIGINNLGQGQSVQQTVEGVAATVSAIEQAQPQARILLMGLLPVGSNIFTPLGIEDMETNYYLATSLPNGQNIFYLGASPLFLSGDGNQNPALTTDYTHPSEQGYSTLASAQIPMIQSLEAATVSGLGPITLAVPSYTGVALIH